MTRLRLCPTVEGNAAPLITHMIGVETCFSRQRAFYHKCYRCQYRGQSAAFEAPLPKEMEAVGEAGAARNGASIPSDRAGKAGPMADSKVVTAAVGKPASKPATKPPKAASAHS